MKPNPFSFGNAVDSSKFLNRKKPLRRIARRLVTEGQSSAIIGEPRIGKTSFLSYLSAEENSTELYGNINKRIIFSSLDSHMFPQAFTPAQFWEQALLPVKEQLIEPDLDSQLSKQYSICKENQFGTFTLEAFFRVLRQDEGCLALLIDEFDALIHHSVLNSVEFFGGLRSITSRSKGSLALVIASRQPIHVLNAETQYINTTGSPFFNIFSEITLGRFPKKDVVTLLRRGDQYFTPADRSAIDYVAGGHPYLLQVAASALWEAYEDRISTPQKRWAYMGNQIYREQDWHFADTWQVWTPATRKAFTSVALCNSQQLLPKRAIATKPFQKELKNFFPELRDLAETGFIVEDTQAEEGWRVEPQVMVWWLSDELVRALRQGKADQPFDQWLKAQEMENWLTQQEKKMLVDFAQASGDILLKGVGKLIESFAEGLGKSWTGS